MGEKPREEEQPENEKEVPEGDWSLSDKILKRMDEEKRAKMTPEELAEDDRRKKVVVDTNRHFDNLRKIETGTPEEKKQAKKELDAGRAGTRKKIDEGMKRMNEQTQASGDALKQRTYEQIKERTEKFRREHGIELSENELRREDEELRRKLGLK